MDEVADGQFAALVAAIVDMLELDKAGVVEHIDNLAVDTGAAAHTVAFGDTAVMASVDA